MRLLRGTEIILDTEVELQRSQLEPDAAAPGEMGRLRDLPQTEHAGVEGARRVLGVPGDGELEVMEAVDPHSP